MESIFNFILSPLGILWFCCTNLYLFCVLCWDVMAVFEMDLWKLQWNSGRELESEREDFWLQGDLAFFNTARKCLAIAHYVPRNISMKVRFLNFFILYSGFSIMSRLGLSHNDLIYFKNYSALQRNLTFWHFSL